LGDAEWFAQTVGGPRPTPRGANRQSSIRNHQSQAVYEYDVYGQVAASDPNHPNRFMFTGREFDKDTGLYYYRARYYNPSIGRFLQTDPIGYEDGISWYRYCHNNSVNCVDPSGLAAYLIFEASDTPDKNGNYEILHVSVAVDTPYGYLIFNECYPFDGGVREAKHFSSLEAISSGRSPNSMIVAFENYNDSDAKIAAYLESGMGPWCWPQFCTSYAVAALSAGGYLYAFLPPITEWDPFGAIPSIPVDTGSLAKIVMEWADKDPFIYTEQMGAWPDLAGFNFWRWVFGYNPTTGEIASDPLPTYAPAYGLNPADPADVTVVSGYISGYPYEGYGIDETGGKYYVGHDGVVEYKGNVGIP